MFARYEACQHGSPEIHPKHLLLGLLRENKALHRGLPKTNLLAIRQRVGEHSAQHPKTSTAIDLSLSEGAKRVLKYAAEEAERMAHRHIGTKPLFLGWLEEEGCLAAQFLLEAGADVASIRQQLATAAAAKQSMPGIYEVIRTRSLGALSGGAILIHGVARRARPDSRIGRALPYLQPALGQAPH